MKRTTLAVLLSMSGICLLKAQEIIPQPMALAKSEGYFTLGSTTKIVVTGDTKNLGERLAAYLRPSTGLPLTVTDKAGANAIHLTLDAKTSGLGEEGYRLEVRPNRIEIQAQKPAGLFYGIQTLRQLLPKEIFRQAPVDGVDWKVPVVSIDDRPRFGWRGSHLDTGRHFMPKEFIKKHLDLMALHKLNVFHWHLTEDQGWRLEIKKYPKLTTVGAWRKSTVLPESVASGEGRPNLLRYDGIPHGGYYSQDDAREIVRYAADRFITVVPEIEMPGHASAAVASYPELGNFPGRKVEVVQTWGIFQSIYNVEDRTIQFNKDVLDEVMAIFPSKYIHVGGDECPKAEWAQSERALARMKQEGIVPASTTLADIQNYKNEKGERAEHPALHKLQSWFIRQMDGYLASKGRRLIGWDEILEGGLAPGAAVMSWRGEEGGIVAAKAGHDVVMAPTGWTYLDYYQSEPPSPEPIAIGDTLLPMAKVYGYEPVPSALSAEEAKHVLGAQGQLWTEYVPTPKQAEYMYWPRLAALAEVLWSPKEKRSLDDFQKRLKPHFDRLDLLDVNYRPLNGPKGFSN